MPVASVRPAEPQRETDVQPSADVVPFSRRLLGRGAQYGDLPQSPDPAPQGSPVYLPGDPRIAE